MTLKNLREKLGTQEEFAKLLNIADKSVVAKWEQGKSAPKTKDLKRIAGVLGVTVDELLTAIENTAKNQNISS